MLIAVGQPLVAEDTWWHLAIGASYAASGPWIAEDPFLFTAAGPPAPAAWLADLALHAVAREVGLSGLRGLHALLVAGILAASWMTLKRASGSRVFASGGTALFVALSAYRLFQLRPELASILAALVLLSLVLRSASTPAPRIHPAWTALFFALWANAHGGFVLGLALLGAAAAGEWLASLLPGSPSATRARAWRLAVALLLGLAGSLVNPAGIYQHGLYFAAGSGTPELAFVADEWAPLHLFAVPAANLPPSPLAWVLVWGLWVATPCAVGLHARARHRRETVSLPELDPALLAAAAMSLIAMLSAVRLLWLGIAPLLVIGQAASALGFTASRQRRFAAWPAAIAVALLAPAFARFGDWPMISRGIDPAVYHRPYPPEKFHAHAVWFLRDAGLEGRLWNDYQSGNFLSYWLAPDLRMFVNGSLNVPAEVIEDGIAARAREGARPGERFVDLLDRHQIDLFFGTGAPVVARANRPARHTTAHLERTPGWILVFRNVDSGVYLRDAERNRTNIARVADYYARAGIPFDPRTGFDAGAVIRVAPDWAERHGLLPAEFRATATPARRAETDALLGLYAQAAASDREQLRGTPGSLSAARRLVWSLLHDGRAAESLAAAEHLAAIAPPQDELSRLLVDRARRIPTLSADDAASLVARLPLFTEPALRRALAAFYAPEARER